MTFLEVLLAISGTAVTVLVVAGMILITPRGEVELRTSEDESQGATLSRARASGQPSKLPVH